MTAKVPQTMTGVPDRAAGTGIALLDTFIHAPGVRQTALSGPLSTGGVINLTAANWRYRIIVQRGW